MKKIFFLLLISMTCHAQVIFPPSSVRTDYAVTPVTTAAWVTLIASLAVTSKQVNIADSGGEEMLLGRFSAGCATQLSTTIIQLGGPGQIPVSFFAGDCVRLKAISGTPAAGTNIMNFSP